MHAWFWLSWIVAVSAGGDDSFMRPWANLSADYPKAADDEGTLELVNLIWRHGDRTPISFYPNDPWKQRRFWPVDPGELLNPGKWRHFHLGQMLRKRYKDFVPKSFDTDVVNIRSTDVDRTLMSAYSNILGFFPPEGYSEWNPDIPWQPFPVHTVPEHEDWILSTAARCRAADQMMQEAMSLPGPAAVARRAKPWIAYINKHAGTNGSTVTDVDYIYDTLLIEASLVFNFSLPAWTAQVFPNTIRSFAEFSFTLYSLTPELKRLRGGPMVARLVENMRESVEGSETKLHVYSGHDSTISMVLGAMGVYNGFFPPYAAMITVELRKLKEQYVVKMMYRNATNDLPNAEHILTLPGCTALCPLADFERLTQSIRPSRAEWDAECAKAHLGGVLRVNYTTVLLLVALTALLLGAVCVWRRQRRGLPLGMSLPAFGPFSPEPRAPLLVPPRSTGRRDKDDPNYDYTALAPQSNRPNW